MNLITHISRTIMAILVICCACQMADGETDDISASRECLSITTYESLSSSDDDRQNKTYVLKIIFNKINQHRILSGGQDSQSSHMTKAVRNYATTIKTYKKHNRSQMDINHFFCIYRI